MNISASTAAGDNDSSLYLCAGGLAGGSGCSAAYGAVILMDGENTANKGDIQISTGDASGSDMYLDMASTNSTVIFRDAGTNHQLWTYSVDGTITQNASYGGNLIFSRSSTGIRLTAGAGLTAAGSAIGDALQLTAIYNDVTTAAAGTGVKLWSNTSGHILTVKNRGANDLLVYPPNGSGIIDGNPAGNAVSVAVGSSGIFIQVSANQWVSVEAGAA